jgi:hypothetical protein
VNWLWALSTAVGAAIGTVVAIPVTAMCTWLVVRARAERKALELWDKRQAQEDQRHEQLLEALRKIPAPARRSR